MDIQRTTKIDRIACLNVPFTVVVILAASIEYFGGKLSPQSFELPSFLKPRSPNTQIHEDLLSQFAQRIDLSCGWTAN